MTSLSGKCACSAIKYSFTTEGGIGVCYCDTCRAWSGGVQMSVGGGKNPTITDPDENLKLWKSSDWAERAFCGKCGSSLFFKFVGGGPDSVSYHFCVGGLDDWKDLQVKSEVFSDYRPAAFTLETPNPHSSMTKEEVLAMYASYTSDSKKREREEESEETPRSESDKNARHD